MEKGKYHILGRLASGGMGEVFLAEFIGEGQFHKKVVLKTIRQQHSQKDHFIQRFWGEAALTCKLNHRNVVQVLDFGTMGDQLYLTMEYVDGISLSELNHLIKTKHISLPEDVILFVMLEAACGLAYLHGLCDDAGRHLQLIHRDISPGNILLSYTGDVKITDFGIAKYKGRTFSTDPGFLLGKVRYIAPEQFPSGENIDQRADLYSYATVFYELIIGKHLIPEVKPVAFFRALHKGISKKILEQPAIVSLGLKDLLSSLLSVNPNERIGSAGQVVPYLENIFRNKRWIPSPSSLANFLQQWKKPRVVKQIDSEESTSITVMVNSCALSPSEAADAAISSVETNKVDITPEKTPIFPRTKWKITAVAGIAALFLGIGFFVYHYFRTTSPKADSPAANEVQNFAILEIKCSPECEVLLDGKPAGIGPLTLNNVEPGFHVIGLKKDKLIRQTTRHLKPGERIMIEEKFE